MTAGDDYVTVSTVLRSVGPRSIFVDRRSGAAFHHVCIPRSLLHGADDLALDRMFVGEEVKLRIRRWKAEQLGLLEDRPPGQKELFG